MKNSNRILFIIFFITVIPTFIVYLVHAYEESISYEKSMAKGDGYKATKQFGEAGTIFINRPWLHRFCELGIKCPKTQGPIYSLDYWYNSYYYPILF